MPIPHFEKFFLPPHLGEAFNRDELSPYSCNAFDLAERFSTSVERRQILRNFLQVREKMTLLGFKAGVQWIGGSFVEDCEILRRRPPHDIDCLTLYDKVDEQQSFHARTSEPSLFDVWMSKRRWQTDHHWVHIGYEPMVTVDQVRYWLGLFGHTREGQWKGILSLELNTPEIDAEAVDYLTPERWGDI